MESLMVGQKDGGGSINVGRSGIDGQRREIFADWTDYHIGRVCSVDGLGEMTCHLYCMYSK